MASKINKGSELTDIPLSLQQGDSIDMNAAQPEKNKMNSLKRIFRTSRSGLQSNQSTKSADLGENEVKNSRSFQMRFGTFGKKHEVQPHACELEASSSSEGSASTKSSGSKLNLQGRISNYWSTVFKKSSKQPSTGDAQSQDVATAATEVNKIEHVQLDNL